MLPSWVSFLSPEISGEPEDRLGFKTATAPSRMTAAIAPTARPVTRCDGLFVEPELWRCGVGAALVEAATHEARRRGLALSVVANPAARGFYERCGFSHEGEAQTRFGPALRMSK